MLPILLSLVMVGVLANDFVLGVGSADEVLLEFVISVIIGGAVPCTGASWLAEVTSKASGRYGAAE